MPGERPAGQVDASAPTGKDRSWQSPRHWRAINSIDAHAAGEPLRVITGGLGDIPGDTMLEKRRYAGRHLDHIRRALMWEPRGHADMYGCIPTAPVTEDGHVGLLFLHNEGFSTMCGHGVIAFVKVALECGLLETGGEGETIRLDTPAGRVVAKARYRGARVASVSFRNVPSFVLHEDSEVHLGSVGRVKYSVAFGGAFYAFVEAAQIGLELLPGSFRSIIESGEQIKRAVESEVAIRHPAGDPDLDFLYGTIFVGPGGKDGVHSRQVCVFAQGELDRSPTGTGVSARAALLHSVGKLPVGESITIESLIGTRFEVRIAELCTFHGRDGVIPEVSGSASITGRHQFLIDPEDPLAEGFLLR